MANRILKRKRASVSYREPSSDDNTSSESVAGIIKDPQSSRLQRKTRRIAQSLSQPSPQKVTRSRRHHAVSYKEPSSDEYSEDDYQDEATTTPRRRSARSQVKSTKINPAPRAKSRQARRQGLFARRSPSKPKNLLKAKPIVSDGIIPAWETLPYHVLLQVFVYASHPLYDDNLSITPSVSWLLRMAHLHSSFSKPALTALYRNPPLFALNKDRRSKVMQLLLEPASDQLEDYRVMVKRLEMDITKMPYRSAPGRADLNFGALVAPLKTLREIEIFDPYDRPPYRQALTTRRLQDRHYPSELFTALEQGGISLKSWTWNHSLCSEGINSEGILWMKDIHGHKSFQTIRDLVLTNFPQDPIWELKKAKDPTPSCEDKPIQEELLASALAALPGLQSLSFVSSTVVNGSLLPLLPTTLVSVSIANCVMLTSEIFGAYLLTHGNYLEELVLNHNPSLNLSFLPDLKRSCPRLEVLRMDLNYYSAFATSRDADPRYDELLGEEEVPSWPSTLQVVDLVYLRKWSGDAAKTFFRSLIDSAKDLPDLRELVLKAMVNVNWRERAAFRDQWIPRFKSVFLESSAQPSDHLVSLRAFREWKASPTFDEGIATATNEGIKREDDEAAAILADITSQSDSIVDSDSDKPILPRGARRRQIRASEQTWGSKRLRNRTDANDSDSPEKDFVVKHIQGRCRVVDIRIDNLRPREEVFGENDFLDSEVSGDEDWNGNDENENDGYAW